MAFRAASSVNGNNTTCSRPTGVVSGDIMVAAVYDEIGPGGTWTPPTGWTLIDAVASAANTSWMHTFYKVAGASEPATYTWTVPAGSWTAIYIVAFSGRDTTTPIDVHGIRQNSAGAAIAPSVTTTVDSDDVLIFGNNFISTASTIPVGWTDAGNNARADFRAAYKTVSPVGATGDQSFGGSDGIGATIAIAPVSTGTDHALTGAVAASPVMAATLTTDKPLSGKSTASPTFAATLTAEKPLAGSTAASPAFAGSLAVERPLAGTVAASPTLTATFTAAKPLAGSIAASPTLAGTLTVDAAVGQHALSGAIAASPAYKAALTVEHPLVGHVDVSPTAQATLTVDKALAGVVSAAPVLFAALTIGINVAYKSPTGTTARVGDLTGSTALVHPTGTSAPASTLTGSTAKE